MSTTVVAAPYLGHRECCECCQESQGSRLPNPHPQNLQHQCQPELNLTSLQTPSNTTPVFITPCHIMPYCISFILAALPSDGSTASLLIHSKMLMKNVMPYAWVATHPNRDGPQQDQQLKPRNPPRQACNNTKVSMLWKRVGDLSSRPCS